MNKKNNRLAINLIMISAGMLMMAYASVPLYRLFCQTTGFGGTTQVAKIKSHKVVDRMVTVRFNADTDPTLDWAFKPEQLDVKTKVGENSLAFYKAVNNSGVAKTGTAIYNVTPEKVGKYFNKVECFCFKKQTIPSGEEVHFPVSFFVDPEFASDPYMDDVDTITLSYTFYEADEAGNAKK